MSYIDIRKEDISEADGRDVVAIAVDHEPDHSLRDGEELMAAAKILELLDELDNGEAIVITVDIF
ncbi:hypothetical protein ACFY1A_17120 [Streptomyces sp. NPDC001520]|uniref:hypothetical protein n=1 Tax=Streptomyces sp. NPDC001520 TaxID=3364581 RepID=UPI0036AD152B